MFYISGKALHVLQGHLGVVRCLHINDERLVSGGDQQKVIVWDYRVSIRSLVQTKDIRQLEFDNKLISKVSII